MRHEVRLGREARLRSLNFVLGVRGNVKGFIKESDKLRFAISRAFSGYSMENWLEKSQNT